jgi:aspartate kinase
MSLLVMKLGGNAISQPGGIPLALGAIAGQNQVWDRLVVVTSALAGVTDTLHEVVQAALNNQRLEFRAQVAQLRAAHVEVAQASISSPQQLDTLLKELDHLFFNLLDDCDILLEKGQANTAIVDQIVAMGEMWMTRIVAAAGRSRGLPCAAVDAQRLIITDDRHGNARPINSLSSQHLAQNLLPMLDQGIIPIITGYIGANEKGAITTLGRGGSDYSATYLGALLSADEIWFFTDVGGLLSADPSIVPQAHILSTSSYKEVAEMARFGARVLHPRAIEPLSQLNIPLRIRAFGDSPSNGTYINAYPDPQENRIHAITQALGLRIIGASHSNMVEVCNRLLAQYLNDDIQPTLQTDTYAGTMVVYVAPTSSNQESFYSAIQHLQSYDSDQDWQVEQVMIIAVVGNLTLAEHVQILKHLHQAHLAPLAFGQGSQNVFLLIMENRHAAPAMQQIHKLIKV